MECMEWKISHGISLATVVDAKAGRGCLQMTRYLWSTLLRMVLYKHGTHSIEHSRILRAHGPKVFKATK